MFDQPGAHLFIPAPPVMLSAVASNSSSATTKRHLDNLSKASSYVQFQQNSVSPRRPATAPTAPRIPMEPMKLAYVPTTSLESIAMTLNINALVSQRQATDGSGENGAATIDAASTDIDAGRDRTMCSSPRERMSAAARLAVLDNMQKSICFAESLSTEGPRIMETLSPSRRNRAEGESGAEMVTVQVQGTPPNGEQTDATEQQHSASNTPRRRHPTSSFASRTGRFQQKLVSTPPVGHYTSRYSVVESSPRSATLRDSRAIDPRIRQPIATAATSREQDPPGDASTAGAEEIVPAATTARERTRSRLAISGKSTIKPSSAFASQIPQVYFHELYRKQHTVGEEPDIGDAYYGVPLPTYNGEADSTTPRVRGRAFNKMMARKEVFPVKSSAPPNILVYNENTSTMGIDARGSVVFATQSCRVASDVAIGVSVEAADLRDADREVRGRIVSIPQFDKQTPRPDRRPSNAGSVAVEMIPNPLLIHAIKDRHTPMVNMKLQLSRFPSGEQDDEESNIPVEVVIPPVFAHPVAQQFPRPPTVSFQMHASHTDVKSFAQQAEQRIAHGDLPSTDIGIPTIEAIRPRISRNLNLQLSPSRNATNARQEREAQQRSNRPELECVDSLLVRARVTADPHISAVTSRDSNKTGRQCDQKPLDQIYDVSYVTKSKKVKQVPDFAVQVNRSHSHGQRIELTFVNRDIIPGPGAYNPI